MPQRRISKLTPAWTMIGVAMLLSGCGDSRPAATPTPSFSCTPDPSGAPCTAELAAAQAEEAKAYAEAEFAYREFTKERNRLMDLGNNDSYVVGSLSRFGTGDYLSFHQNTLDRMRQAGLKAGPGVVILSVKGVSVDSGELVLRACEDGRENVVKGANGEVLGRGSLISLDLQAKRESGAWLIASSKESEVSACP